MIYVTVQKISSKDPIAWWVISEKDYLNLALLRNTLHRGIIHCIFLRTKQQSHTGITEVLLTFYSVVHFLIM